MGGGGGFLEAVFQSCITKYMVHISARVFMLFLSLSLV